MSQHLDVSTILVLQQVKDLPSLFAFITGQEPVPGDLPAPLDPPPAILYAASPTPNMRMYDGDEVVEENEVSRVPLYQEYLEDAEGRVEVKVSLVYGTILIPDSKIYGVRLVRIWFVDPSNSDAGLFYVGIADDSPLELFETL